MNLFPTIIFYFNISRLCYFDLFIIKALKLIILNLLAYTEINDKATVKVEKTLENFTPTARYYSLLNGIH